MTTVHRSAPAKKVSFAETADLTEIHTFVRSDRQKRDLWIQPHEYYKMYSDYQKAEAWKATKRWFVPAPIRKIMKRSRNPVAA